MNNKNNKLLNSLLPNLNMSEEINNNNKIDFNEIKNKIIIKSKEMTIKKIGIINHKVSKKYLINIFAKNSLVVAVRIRKLNKKEIEYSVNETIKKIDRDTIIITEPTDEIRDLDNEITKQLKMKQNYFSFDFIFEKEATQEEIYLNTCKILLEEVLEGYNATIFAYGATGSGKTYTMVGNGENPGIMVRVVSDLFSMIELKKNKKINIKVMYVEVYNENTYDLISGNSNLEVRDDPKMGIQILGASEEQVLIADDIFKLLM